MKNVIREMVEIVNRTHDYEMAESISKLLAELSGTWNCPSNWQDIAEDFRINLYIKTCC